LADRKSCHTAVAGDLLHVSIRIMASFDLASVRKPDQAATVDLNAPSSRIAKISRAVRHSLSTAANALSLMVGGFVNPSTPE
jgi:hypothetical protein